MTAKCRFGLEKTSLIDFPGTIASVVFTCGCNLRCPYCHNPELVTGHGNEEMLGWEEIVRFLKKRRTVLQGVCISGGEPLLFPHIGELVNEIKKLGYKVKIDTNGTLPDTLETLTLDYIALDFKTSPSKYPLLGGTRENGEAVVESIETILRKRIPHEIRITLAPEIFDWSDAQNLVPYLKGAQQVVLTGVRLENSLSREYKERTDPYPFSFLKEVNDLFLKEGIPCRIRRKGLSSGEGT